jgi:uncharacterized membrane protein
VRAHAWTLALAGAMTAWTAVLFAIVRTHHLEFRTQKFDLGNMVQAVWSTTQGRPLEITNASGEQLSRLSSHVDPILALLAPAWMVAPTPLTLAFLQIAACALGALPVFWLGRRHLESEALAATLALAYLAYPWLAWVALDAMHPVTLAIPFLLFAVWALDCDRLALFALFALLTCLTGELMGVTVAAFGLWYALARGRRRAGLAIGAAGLAWTFVSLYVIVPRFSGGESVFYGAYDAIGGSPQGVLRTAFTNPGTILGELLTEDSLRYVFELAVPLAGLFLLAPGLAAVALPQLLANVLSDLPTTSDPYWHYASALVPILVAATVLGIARLPSRGRGLAAAAVLGLSIGLSAILGPWPQLQGPSRLVPHQEWYGGTPPPGHLEALRDALALVPADAPVSSTGKVGAHLSARRYVYSVPVLGRAEWVVVDERDPVIPPGAARSGDRTFERGVLDPARIARFVAELDSSPAWERVLHRSGVSVYRRVADPERAP